MKDNHKGIQEPVLTPGEAWHLGRMDALQVAAKVLKKYVRRPNVTVAEVARATERDLAELADECLVGYYDAAGKVCTATEPPTVVFDPDMGVPLLVRPRVPTGGWGLVDLPDTSGGSPIILATPFRAMDLKVLPKGTAILKIRDPAHSALASVIEVLDCMRRDIDAAAVAVDEDAALGRMARLLVVYAHAASFAVGALEDDDFADWKSKIPDIADITMAPAAIAATAIKARAQAAVALQLCAIWLASVSDRAMDAPKDSRMKHMASAVDDATAKLRPLLDSVNGFLGGQGSEAADYMVIINHGGGSLPVLAMIPKGSCSLHQLRTESVA